MVFLPTFLNVFIRSIRKKLSLSSTFPKVGHPSNILIIPRGGIGSRGPRGQSSLPSSAMPPFRKATRCSSMALVLFICHLNSPGGRARPLPSLAVDTTAVHPTTHPPTLCHAYSSRSSLPWPGFFFGAGASICSEVMLIYLSAALWRRVSNKKPFEKPIITQGRKG